MGFDSLVVGRSASGLSSPSGNSFQSFPVPARAFLENQMEKGIEAAQAVLTSGNGTAVILGAFAILLLLVLAAAFGLLDLRLPFLRLKGGKGEWERRVIQKQMEAAYIFIMSLEGKIQPKDKRFGGYFLERILERVYDKALEWIVFNHINTTSLYVEDKQDAVCSLVYTFPVDDEFKTPEFNARMRAWTRELIERLVRIRELCEGKNGLA